MGFREPKLGNVPRPGEWTEKAACRLYPTEWWFPFGGEFDERRPLWLRKADAQVARRICQTCPVASQCDTHAECYGEYGIWASLDRDDRRRLRDRYKKHPDSPRRNAERRSA